MPGTQAAEVAVAVDPDWRNNGVGLELLTSLGLAAVARGIRQFQAFYAGDNVTVTRLVHKTGLPDHTVIANGTAEVTVELDPCQWSGQLVGWDDPHPPGRSPSGS